MRWHTHTAGILSILLVGLFLAPAASAASASDLATSTTDPKDPDCVQIHPYSEYCEAVLGLVFDQQDPGVETTQCLAVYPFCGGDAGDLVDYAVDKATEPLP